MNEDDIKLIRTTIKKAAIDEGMEQILELLMSYNVNDDERLTNVITYLTYISCGDEEE